MTKKELIDCIENGRFRDGRKIRIGYCYKDGTDIPFDEWNYWNATHENYQSPEKTAWIFAGLDADYEERYNLIAIAENNGAGSWTDWNFNVCDDTAFCEARDEAEEMDLKNNNTERIEIKENTAKVRDLLYDANAFSDFVSETVRMYTERLTEAANAHPEAAGRIRAELENYGTFRTFFRKEIDDYLDEMNGYDLEDVLWAGDFAYDEADELLKTIS